MSPIHLPTTFFLLLSFLSVLPTGGQEPHSPTPASEVVHQRLLEKSQELLAQRKAAYEKRTSVDDIRKHQQQLKR